MILFTPSEIKFLKSLEEARVATSHSDIPHVKPVSYVYHEGVIFYATDYNTRNYKNLKINSNIAISIDTYKSKDHKAVLIQGNAEIIENGEEFEQIYSVFFDKFQWVRDTPWKENEAPFVKIIPKKKTSWGLSD